MTRDRLDRRTFLTAASALALTTPYAACGLATDDETPSGDEPKRDPARLPAIELGTTGRTVPRLGFGGYPICRLSTHDEAVRVLRRAFDLGVRYIDTAPSYGRGRSERRIGLALKGYDRSEFFIATKTLERRADGARRELEESLKRLDLDHVDSIQVHAVHDDVDTLFGRDAVLEGLEKARDEKLTRHIGITGHVNPSYLIDAIGRFDFATALVPINPIDTKYLSFTREFVPAAKERNVAVIAMKVFAGGSLLSGGQFTAAELLRYALSQDHVAIAVPGCEAVSHVEEAWDGLADFQPLTAELQRALEARAGEHKGRASEWYKERRD